MIPFPVVDTHVHLWDPKRLRYPWLDHIPLLNRPYLLDEYSEATRTVNVERIVFLQCDCAPEQYHEEAQWVSALAKADARIQGIVPWAPIEKGGAVRGDLELLARDPLVKGIRRIVQSEEDKDFCLRPGFVEGVRLCAAFGLHFEICVSHAQLGRAVELVRRCPDVRFVLDHIGNPDIARQITEPWKSEMKELAALPNVWCKMSGLVVGADRERWTPNDLRPYIEHVLDVFGFDRTFFGGDWPVVLLAAELARWMEVLYATIQHASSEDQKKLFAQNAIDFYGLAAPAA